jgi:hypothetical protein
VLQVIYESSATLPDDLALQDTALQKAAEKDGEYYGPERLSAVMNPPRVAASGSIKEMKFCDTESGFWQVAQLHAQLHNADSGSCFPYLGARA